MIDALADLTVPSAVFLAVSCCAAGAVPYFLLVGVELTDLDPRPATRRALESGRYDRLLIAVAAARYLARYRARHAKPSRFNALKGAAR